MPQSLSAVYVHLTFSTKERRVFLRDRAVRDALHPYIDRQEEHHRNITFQDELGELLRKHHIEFDERFVWE